MTLRSRQRRRTAQQRTPSPPPQKWPETMEELNALPDFSMKQKVLKTPAAPNDRAAVRTWPEENKHPSPRAEAPWHRLPLAPITKQLPSDLPLRIKPSYSPPTPTPFQFETSPTDQRNAYIIYKDPDPNHNLPLQPEPAANTSSSYKLGMVDPGMADAQQVQAKRDKDLQEWAKTAAIASAMGLATPKYPNGQPTKPEAGGLGANPSSIYGWTEWDVPAKYSKPISGGAADSGLLQAGLWYKTIHPDLYPNSKYINLAPGDGEENPYGIDVNEFLRWAYSQLGYHEKSSGDELFDKAANSGSDNWTQYGVWYGDWYDAANKDSSFDNARWCAMFASWCAMKAGISEELIKHTGSTDDFKRWYQKQGRFAPNGSEYKPKAGDIILYQWTEDDGSLGGHTGIVVAYAVEKGIPYVYTIEGNLADQVYFRKVPLSKSSLKGFGINGGNSYGIVPPHYIDNDGKLT